MAYSWLAVALRDGQVITPLPDLTCESVGVRICNYQTAQGSLPVGGTGRNAPPADWQRATTEGATVYVLLDDPGDGSTSVPVWGGYLTKAEPSTGDTIPLPLSTLEAYLDCRYVGDVTYTATDQNTIVSDLIARFVNDGTINIRVQVVGGAGTVRDHTYTDASNKSVLSALTELAGVVDGPEWTIGWEWSDAEHITPVLYVGNRLGTAVTPGFMPNAVFEAPGSIISAALTRDFSKGKGANRVIASSSASATTQPTSPPQVYSDPLRPTFEYRFTPSTSISDVNTLTEHAQAALAQMQQGSRALTMTAAVESAPRLGRDWSLGDDIGYKIGGPEYDPGRHWGDAWSDIWSDVWGSLVRNTSGRESVPAFPGGISGTARALGWDLTISGVQTVTPILGGV